MCFFLLFILIFLFLSACLYIALPITFPGPVERQISQTTPFTSYQIGPILPPYHVSLSYSLYQQSLWWTESRSVNQSSTSPLPSNLTILMLSLFLSCSVYVSVCVRFCLCFSLSLCVALSVSPVQ